MFNDHVAEVNAAIARRRSLVGKPESRDRLRNDAIEMSKAILEVHILMKDSSELDTIVDVVSDAIIERVWNYAATYIPSGNDDDLRDAFENCASNCFENDTVLADQAYFHRLDKALNDFMRDELGLWQDDRG